MIKNEKILKFEVNNDDEKDYKGQHFGENTEKEHFEGGAHFRYKDLFKRLTDITEKLSETQLENKVIHSSKDVNKKDIKFFDNTNSENRFNYKIPKNNSEINLLKPLNVNNIRVINNNNISNINVNINLNFSKNIQNDPIAILKRSVDKFTEQAQKKIEMTLRKTLNSHSMKKSNSTNFLNKGNKFSTGMQNFNNYNLINKNYFKNLNQPFNSDIGNIKNNLIGNQLEDLMDKISQQLYFDSDISAFKNNNKKRLSPLQNKLSNESPLPIAFSNRNNKRINVEFKSANNSLNDPTNLPFNKTLKNHITNKSNPNKDKFLTLKNTNSNKFMIYNVNK